MRQYAIVLEDDLEVAVDFFEYMSGTTFCADALSTAHSNFSLATVHSLSGNFLPVLQGFWCRGPANGSHAMDSNFME